MEINGIVRCLFEQSGTFKNEFIKLGFQAYDYDIKNDFGQTDFVMDLFVAIEDCWRGLPSVFDSFKKDDLLLAFFPCIHFCDAKSMVFRHEAIYMREWSLDKKMSFCIDAEFQRHNFFLVLLMLVSICAKRGFRLVIENPWNPSGQTFLQTSFPKPSIIDRDRSARGDKFVKPTAYWFFGCEASRRFSYNKSNEVLIVNKLHDKNPVTGQCSVLRSSITPEYARSFICDNILGVPVSSSQMSLFD